MNYRWIRNRQRALALLLAGSMLAATGCGGSGNTEEKPETVQAEEEQTEQDTEQQADDGQPELYPAVPKIIISSEMVDNYDSESGQWLLHAEYNTVEAEGEGSEGVAAAVQQWSNQREEELRAFISQYTSEAAVDESMEPDDYYRYSIFHELQTARADERVVSLIETTSEYFGGAHGEYGSSGVNFDAQSGKILQLSDILTEEEGFHKKAEEYIIQKLSEMYEEGLFPGYEDTVRGMWDHDQNWYLDAAGITFIFTPYEIGPYAMGEVFVTLPYMEVMEYLADSYVLERSLTHMGAGIAKIPIGERISLFLSAADSQQEQFRLSLEEREEWEWPVRVELDNFSVETDSFERIGDAYLVCQRDGRVFVVFDADYASDDFVTFVYELTDGILQERDRQEGLSLQNGKINVDGFRLGMHLDVLGTYEGLMDYTIDSEGRLKAASEWYEIVGSDNSWRLLVTVRELPVLIDGEETTLPAGSRIRITTADNAGKVRFLDKDTGLEGEIHYVRGDGEEDLWTIHIVP